MISNWPTTSADAARIQLALREQLVPHPPAGFALRLIAGADMSMIRGNDVGYAGFAELPPLEAAWARLRRRPDVVIFDGHGYAHPRRFGLACLGGVLFGVPSVGCAKSILVGTHDALGEEAGSSAPLVHRGEVVGAALRLRDRTGPVYVSLGHMMDLETAVRIVRAASAGYREPETTRRAHRLVNEARTAGSA